MASELPWSKCSLDTSPGTNFFQSYNIDKLNIKLRLVLFYHNFDHKN